MNAGTNSYDVIIVGAGPAGSGAAIRLALAGRQVLLVEQKSFPRQKLCGEFISPECLVHFEELGAGELIGAAGGVDINETVFFARNGHGVTVDSEWLGHNGSAALGLSRAAMDERLLERAREVGVELREHTTASSLIFDGERVAGVHLRDAVGDVSEVAAALTIDATGRTRSLARKLDPPRSAGRNRATHVAFKTHLRSAQVTPHTCEIYVYRGGYGGCSRVEDGLYNLCFIMPATTARRLHSDPERAMREVVMQNRQAAASLAGAYVAGDWQAVPIERFGRGGLVPAAGLLTVGDAAAFIDPFTGSGILMALESGKIAAEAICNWSGRPSDLAALASDYSRGYAAAFDRRLRVCSVLRMAAFVPFLAETVIAVLSRSSMLRRMLARATRSDDGVHEL